jgi:hypothetical protein
MMIASPLTPRTQVMIAQFKKITLAVALGASAIAMAAPAEAQRYGGYRGRDNGETAVIAGVAGLAIGAALASSARRDRDRDYAYDRGYDRGYERPVVSYPPVYNGYYAGGYRGYDSYRGYNSYRDYNDEDARHGGGYDRGRGGYDRGYGGYDHRGWDGYRR